MLTVTKVLLFGVLQPALPPVLQAAADRVTSGLAAGDGWVAAAAAAPSWLDQMAVMAVVMLTWEDPPSDPEGGAVPRAEPGPAGRSRQPPQAAGRGAKLMDLNAFAYQGPSKAGEEAPAAQQQQQQRPKWARQQKVADCRENAVAAVH